MAETGPWRPPAAQDSQVTTRKASTIVTSNGLPAEWLTMMSDVLFAAVDRLSAHTLIIEGPSNRQPFTHRHGAADANYQVR